MQVSKNKVVTVTYELHCNLPGDVKHHIESTDIKNPLSFIFGTGMMIPGFEKGLDGKIKGDKFSFSIESEDAYGSMEETAVIKLPIEIFKVGGILDLKLLQIGKILPLNDDEGNVLYGTVLAFDTETVTMDFNHPLAGHQLHFAGDVVEIRDASEQELSHGHVH